MFQSFSRKRPTRPSRTPGLEALEQRDVPTIALANGVVTIRPDDPAAEVSATTTVQVHRNGTVLNAYDDKLVVTRSSPGRDVDVKTYPLWQTLPTLNGGKLRLRLVTKIDFQGGAGDEVFKNRSHIKAVALGGSADNWLHAGSGGDTLVAGPGNDHLFGGAGHDNLFAGAGRDVLVSIGGGYDELTAGIGDADFWYDTKDVANVPSPQLLGSVTHHRVQAFFSYSYNGGAGKTPVSLELRGQNLADPLPGMVGLKMKNYRGVPLFGAAGPQVSDIDQGAVGDCYFVATLGAMAKTKPDSVRHLVTDLGDGTYAVHFRNARGQSVFVRVDADLWTNAEGSPAFAGLGAQHSLWVPIVEKAWAFYRAQKGNYPSIAGGFSPGVPMEVALNFKQPAARQAVNFPDAASYLLTIQHHLLQGRGVTFSAPAGFSNKTPMVKSNNAANTFHNGDHVYVVDSVQQGLNGLPTGITLYNPAGGYVTVTNPNLIFFCSYEFRSFGL